VGPIDKVPESGLLLLHAKQPEQTATYVCLPNLRPETRLALMGSILRCWECASNPLDRGPNSTTLELSKRTVICILGLLTLMRHESK
jgi:hypothetical protein